MEVRGWRLEAKELKVEDPPFFGGLKERTTYNSKFNTHKNPHFSMLSFRKKSIKNSKLRIQNYHSQLFII
jgi:hypothetical protein